MAEGSRVGDALAAEEKKVVEARAKLVQEAAEREQLRAELTGELERERADFGGQLARSRARENASDAAIAKTREEADQAYRAHQLVRRELTTLQGDLERERARCTTMLADIARLRAEFEEARHALAHLRHRHGEQRMPLVRALARRVRARPVRGWLQPRRVVDKLRELRRVARQRRLVEASGLFDREFYLAEQVDVARSGTDPAEHFVRYGGWEGRDPHPLFDTSFYLETYPDVAASGVNPLVHFVTTGWKERRRPHRFFDTGYYLDHNPDVADAGVNPVVHYDKVGAAEGRDPHPDFCTRRYLEEHPEATAGGWNPLAHAMRSGDTPSVPRAAAPEAAGDAAMLARWREQVEALPRRALVMDDTLLTPDRDSGSVTTLELMKTLQALGYSVTFVPHDLKHVDRYVEALETAGLFCLTQKAVYSVHEFLKSHGSLFDLVVLCRISTACHLVDQIRAWCPAAALLFETMDLHYLRIAREAALTGSKETQDAAEATKAMELDLVRRADVTIVHSVVEIGRAHV